MNSQNYIEDGHYTSTKAVSHICTFPKPLSGLVPGVPVFRSKDTHRVLSRSGGSAQDMVELLHYVTTRGCSQTTTWNFIQNIQLKDLGGGGGGVGLEGKKELGREQGKKG